MKRQTELDALTALEREYYKAKKAYRKAYREYSRHGNAALVTVQNSIEYTYNVCGAITYPYFVKYADGVDAVKVSRVWTVATVAMVERFNAEYPQHAIKATTQAAKYYRTHEGILDTHGGGYRVLETPCLCSDAQWAELKAGIVPISFIR